MGIVTPDQQHPASDVGGRRSGARPCDVAKIDGMHPTVAGQYGLQNTMASPLTGIAARSAPTTPPNRRTTQSSVDDRTISSRLNFGAAIDIARPHRVVGGQRQG